MTSRMGVFFKEIKLLSIFSEKYKMISTFSEKNNLFLIASQNKRCIHYLAHINMYKMWEKVKDHSQKIFLDLLRRRKQLLDLSQCGKSHIWISNGERLTTWYAHALHQFFKTQIVFKMNPPFTVYMYWSHFLINGDCNLRKG